MNKEIVAYNTAQTPANFAICEFLAAKRRNRDVSEIETTALKRWLTKAISIQWDYKNIVKRKGRLEKIGNW